MRWLWARSDKLGCVEAPSGGASQKQSNPHGRRASHSHQTQPWASAFVMSVAKIETDSGTWLPQWEGGRREGGGEIEVCEGWGEVVVWSCTRTECGVKDRPISLLLYVSALLMHIDSLCGRRWGTGGLGDLNKYLQCNQVLWYFTQLLKISLFWQVEFVLQTESSSCVKSGYNCWLLKVLTE